MSTIVTMRKERGKREQASHSIQRTKLKWVSETPLKSENRTIPFENVSKNSKSKEK